MASAASFDIQYTPESCHEAVVLKAYCESKFKVGPSTTRWASVTGEPYIELCVAYQGSFESAEAARIEAQSHFDRYAEGKSGTLYWRVPPEIALSTRRQRYAYYLRLLISDKPKKVA